MGQGPFRIVLADDVMVDLEIARSFLQRRGFEVFGAEDGLTALELSIAKRPHLVILDHVMPGLTGGEICERLKSSEETREIHVVIFSAHDTEETRETCHRAGADAFVSKSRGREELLRVVSKTLHVPLRRSARITVLFSVGARNGAKETLGRAVDLAEGGMGLEVNRSYEIGASLMLRFMVPGGQREINARGRVCWVQERSEDLFAMGLQFTDVPGTDQLRLRTYIDETLARRESAGSSASTI